MRGDGGRLADGRDQPVDRRLPDDPLPAGLLGQTDSALQRGHRLRRVARHEIGDAQMGGVGADVEYA
jgi:hypothetical protein